VIRIVTKIELIGPWTMPYPSKKFRQNPFTTFSVHTADADATQLDSRVASAVCIGHYEHFFQ